MENELGLTGKEMKKMIAKVESITDLNQLLSVEVKGQHPKMHTFYKVKGRIIETKQRDDYSPSEIEEETVQLNENLTKLVESEPEFMELLELRLANREVNVDDISKRKIIINDFVEELEEAKNAYQKERKNQKMDLDVNLINSAEKFVGFLKDMEAQKGRRLHPLFNPNEWGESTYKLFTYLFDNYYDDGKRTKRRLTNIWFYLTNLGNEYPFYMTKVNYKAFILHNYHVEISNFDKVGKYDDTEYPKMEDHRINFKDGMTL